MTRPDPLSMAPDPKYRHKPAPLPVSIETHRPVVQIGLPDIPAEVFIRECFMCGKSGWCGHREPLVELAYIEALARGARRIAR